MIYLVRQGQKEASYLINIIQCGIMLQYYIKKYSVLHKKGCNESNILYDLLSLQISLFKSFAHLYLNNMYESTSPIIGVTI